MFSEEVIPSLMFSKAELSYLLFVMMRDISINNNTERVDLVEVRHYFNQIKDKVLLSTFNGELKEAVQKAVGGEGIHKENYSNGDHGTGEAKRQNNSATGTGTIEELRKRFPTLSDTEINEILTTAKNEQMAKLKEEIRQKEEKERAEEVPSFLRKKKRIVTEEEAGSFEFGDGREKGKKKGTDSQKFANMLGS